MRCLARPTSHRHRTAGRRRLQIDHQPAAIAMRKRYAERDAELGRKCPGLARVPHPPNPHPPPVRRRSPRCAHPNVPAVSTQSSSLICATPRGEARQRDRTLVAIDLRVGPPIAREAPHASGPS